ncbi:hypothetical protein MWH25_05660 [Natroniella acetigena]|nr:hypothetical protein [Natroniella acetigena]MCK8827226.1 hypothetical protein [Natroniella acetigena]
MENQVLGLDKYQIRSIKGIERIWVLQSFTHLFCTIGLDKPMKFGEDLRKARNQSESQKDAELREKEVVELVKEYCAKYSFAGYRMITDRLRFSEGLKERLSVKTIKTISIMGDGYGSDVYR